MHLHNNVLAQFNQNIEIHLRCLHSRNTTSASMCACVESCVTKQVSIGRITSRFNMQAFYEYMADANVWRRAINSTECIRMQMTKRWLFVDLRFICVFLLFLWNFIGLSVWHRGFFCCCLNYFSLSLFFFKWMNEIKHTIRFISFIGFIHGYRTLTTLR